MSMKKMFSGALAIGALLLAVGFTAPAQAQDAPKPEAAAATAAAPAAAAPAAPKAEAAAPAAAAPAAPAAAAAAPAPVPNKGDTAWMLVCTAFVILMTLPGLGLFYGGLVRSKNMLSVLMQVFVTFSLIVVLWAVYGYSLAFTQGNGWLSPYFGGGSRLFLSGTFDAVKGTFSNAATLRSICRCSSAMYAW